MRLRKQKPEPPALLPRSLLARKRPRRSRCHWDTEGQNGTLRASCCPTVNLNIPSKPARAVQSLPSEPTQFGGFPRAAAPNELQVPCLCTHLLCRTGCDSAPLPRGLGVNKETRPSYSLPTRSEIPSRETKHERTHPRMSR